MSASTNMKHFSDLHTERACLATAITRHDALKTFVALEDEHFYNESNKIVFKALKIFFINNEKELILHFGTLFQNPGIFKNRRSKLFVELPYEQTIVNFGMQSERFKLSLRRKLYTLRKDK